MFIYHFVIALGSLTINGLSDMAFDKDIEYLKSKVGTDNIIDFVIDERLQVVDGKAVIVKVG
jgi:hypothetical protein